MKLLLIIWFFSLPLMVSAQWESVPGSPSGTIRHGINTSYPSLGNEALFAGDFSGRVVRFSVTTGVFTNITGFEATDFIFGFFKRAGNWYVNGYFKRNNLHYLAMQIDLSANSASPTIQTVGPGSQNARLEVVGYGLNDTLLLYGQVLGTVFGTNLTAPKVGKLAVNNTVVPAPELRPNGATAKIFTLGTDNTGNNIVLGDFTSLGVNNPVSTNDLAVYTVYNGTVTPISAMPAQFSKHCRGYNTGIFGWNGDTLGLSLGGLRLSGVNLVNLSSGWEINPLSISRKNNLWFFSGYKNGSSGSCLASWDSLTSSWNNRQGDLFTAPFDTNYIAGTVTFANSDIVIAFGNLTVNNSTFVGMAKTTITTVPLPVELVSFTARLWTNGSVRLDWSTATEINNKGWTIERSNDGIAWVSIAFVFGAGNSTEQKNYDWIDDEPGTGVVYYRLRQEDFDGNISFSPIVSVSLPGDVPVIYPNPSDGRIIVQFTEIKSTVTIRIFDALSNIVTTSNHTEVPWLELKISLPNGAYTIEISVDGKTYTKSLVIARQ